MFIVPLLWVLRERRDLLQSEGPIFYIKWPYLSLLIGKLFCLLTVSHNWKQLFNRALKIKLSKLICFSLYLSSWWLRLCKSAPILSSNLADCQILIRLKIRLSMKACLSKIPINFIVPLRRSLRRPGSVIHSWSYIFCTFGKLWELSSCPVSYCWLEEIRQSA